MRYRIVLHGSPYGQTMYRKTILSLEGWFIILPWAMQLILNSIPYFGEEDQGFVISGPWCCLFTFRLPCVITRMQPMDPGTYVGFMMLFLLGRA